MAFDVQEFKKEFQKKFEELFAYGYESGSKTEQYIALGDLVRGLYSDDWIQTVTDYNKKKEKQVFYFSMEFLPGRMLKSNLLNMGIMDCVKQGLEELGLDLDEVARAEVDPALGNGGLGRLASCFMDSIASTGLAGNGNGIRYRYGLFKQKFIKPSSSVSAEMSVLRRMGTASCVCITKTPGISWRFLTILLK